MMIEKKLGVMEKWSLIIPSSDNVRVKAPGCGGGGLLDQCLGIGVSLRV